MDGLDEQTLKAMTPESTSWEALHALLVKAAAELRDRPPAKRLKAEGGLTPPDDTADRAAWIAFLKEADAARALVLSSRTFHDEEYVLVNRGSMDPFKVKDQLKAKLGAVWGKMLDDELKVWCVKRSTFDEHESDA